MTVLLFSRDNVTPSDIDAMDFSDLRYWFGIHEILVDAEHERAEAAKRRR